MQTRRRWFALWPQIMKVALFNLGKKFPNYAKNMVILNHFDYADYAKSKAFRSGIGRFMFQFQHYSMEFFERNIKILREAKGDVLAGELMPGGDARGLAPQN